MRRSPRKTTTRARSQRDTLSRTVRSAPSIKRRKRPCYCLAFSIAGIAATLALLIAIGGYHLWHTHGQTTDDVCIAYVNGKVLDNSDEVMALIEQDLNSINAASQGMAAQLSSLGEAIELDNE